MVDSRMMFMIVFSIWKKTYYDDIVYLDASDDVGPFIFGGLVAHQPTTRHMLILVLLVHSGSLPFTWLSLGRSWRRNWPRNLVTLSDEYLGGGLKYLLFSPLLGEMIEFDEYFSNELKPPTRYPFPNVRLKARS